jgi:hypothetical protein
MFDIRTYSYLVQTLYQLDLSHTKYEISRDIIALSTIMPIDLFNVRTSEKAELTKSADSSNRPDQVQD